MVADLIDVLLGEKGCDADVIREDLAKTKVEAVIRVKISRRNPELYRGR